MPERYSSYLNINAVNELITMLLAVYNQTGNETIGMVATRLAQVRDQAHVKFWDEETYWRADEIKEALGNLDALPHAVRTWLLFYRDQELE